MKPDRNNFLYWMARFNVDIWDILAAIILSVVLAIVVGIVLVVDWIR